MLSQKLGPILIEATRPLFTWMIELINPVLGVKSYLELGTREGITGLLLNRWAIPLVISISIDAVVLNFAGIDFKKDPYTDGLYLIAACFEHVVGALTLFVFIRTFRSNITMNRVFCYYTIIVTISPVITVLSFHQIFGMVTWLKSLKALNMPFIETIRYYVKHPTEFNVKDGELHTLFNAFAWVAAVLGLLVRVIVAESINQIEKADRFRTYLSVGFASAFEILPQIPFVISEWALISGLS